MQAQHRLLLCLGGFSILIPALLQKAALARTERRAELTVDESGWRKPVTRSPLPSPLTAGQDLRDKCLLEVDFSEDSVCVMDLNNQI